MGGKQSHDIDKQRIQEITKEVTDQFLKDFKLWYREIINEKVKSQNIWKESRFHLLQAPVPHRPLKKGFIFKLGGNVKSWKRRYLVAYNKTDNFILRYYDDNTLSRCRGSIDCCGYSVRTFMSDEDDAHHSLGIYGIQLVPDEENKRVWCFRMSTTKEQDEWIQIFLNACKKTSPDPNRDMYYVAAFQRALKATKASYGYYGLCEAVTSETELLSQLTKRILRREMIDEYIQRHHQTQLKRSSASIKRSSSRSASVATGGFGGNAALTASPFSFMATSSSHPQQDSIILISQVNDIVNAVIQPMIINTYKRTLLYVGETTAKYEDSVRVALSQLMTTERSIYDFLLKKLKSVIDPTLHDLTERIFAPILEKMFDKFLLSFDRLFFNFSLQLAEKTKHFLSYSDTLRGIDRLDNVIDTISSSAEDSGDSSAAEKNCLFESYDILWTLMTKELIDVADVFEGCDIQPFSAIYLNTTEDMRQCIHNVLFTFKCLLKNGYEEEKTAQHQKYCQYVFWLKSLKTASHATSHSDPANSPNTSSKTPTTPIPTPTTPNTPNTPNTPSTPAPASSNTPSSSKQQRSKSTATSTGSEPAPQTPHRSHSSSTPSSASSSDIACKLELLYTYFEHDLYELMIARIVEILSDMVEITVQEAVLMPSQDIFAAARGMERDCAFIVHLPCLGERIVRDCVRAYLLHYLTASVSSYGVRIKLQLQECRRMIWQRLSATTSLGFADMAGASQSITSSQSQSIGGAVEEGSLYALPSRSIGHQDSAEIAEEEEEDEVEES